MNSNSQQQQQSPAKSRPVIVYILNIVIGIALLMIGYFSYAFIAPTREIKDEVSAVPQKKKDRAIQIDVLNGCGNKGLASRCTSFLRTSGFDVVEMKNYRSSTIRETLVIDRVGNLDQAKRVAVTLGVSPKHIIQQISTDYFVDVSVVIGSDYPSLTPWHQ